MHSATPSTIAHISQSQDSTVSQSAMPESCRRASQPAGDERILYTRRASRLGDGAGGSQRDVHVLGTRSTSGGGLEADLDVVEVLTHLEVAAP